MAQQKYEIIERIGRGGMAEVFKASSTSLEGFKKLVAIKRVLPSMTEDERFVQMFLDEAKVALPLNHTNIVQTFDLGRANDTYFIVMEYVEGTDLESVIESLGQRGEQLDAPEAAFIGLEVCKGLVHAHRQTNAEGEPLNMVHRDISPPNVLVSRDGEVKITDFGLAKARTQVDLTDPGVVKGKFGYLSPEAAEGEPVDARTDLFAIGIILWEMLTGERLFLGENDYETLEQVRKTEIPSLESAGRLDVPEALSEILYHALERDPEQRYQTARQMGQDLAAFLFEHGEVMTSFDLARRVERALDGERTSPEATTSLGSFDRAVQQEINQFVSLEEIAELDLRMANRGTIEDSESSVEGDPGDFEDPRAWGDTDLDDDPKPEGLASQSQAEDAWREQGLDEVAAVTQSNEAIEGPDETDDDSETTAPDITSLPDEPTDAPEDGGDEAAEPRDQAETSWWWAGLIVAVLTAGALVAAGTMLEWW